MEYDKDDIWAPDAGINKGDLSLRCMSTGVVKWTPEIGKQTIDFIRAQYLGPEIITKFKQ